MERIQVLEKQQSFCQFRHEHPLKQTNSPPKPKSFCSACKLNIIKNHYYYKCQTCPLFFLHKVCHNMPKKTQHPSHPNHHLTLQKASYNYNPTSKPLKCMACEEKVVDGQYFYGYEKEEEDKGNYQYGNLICYHALCSALPLSMPVSCHAHELKLEFSPPYMFRCDVCAKTSRDGNIHGWLYRCRICEFDAHLTCAVSNKKILLQSKFSSKTGFDHYREDVEEVMRLQTERFRKINDNNAISPKNYEESSSMSISSLGFSEACFSIDLGRSFSGNCDNNCGDDQDYCHREEVEGKAIISDNLLKPSNAYSNNYSFNDGRDDHKMREAFLVRNDTLTREELLLGQVKKKKGKFNSAFGNQSKNRSNGSSWQKLLLCFRYST